VLRHADRNEPAFHTLGTALAAAERRGSIAGYALASIIRASLLLRAGEIPEAEADARAGLDAAPSAAWSRWPGVGVLVEVLVERGALDEAERLLVDNGADGELPDLRPATVLLLSRAAFLHERGDAAGALADLERARAARPLHPDRRGRPRRSDPHRARAACARRRGSGATRGRGRPRRRTALGHARRARHGHARLRPRAADGDGLNLLRDAARVLEGSPRRLEHARALVDLGAALRRRGERVAAREPLRHALDLAHECGGLAVAERAREELTTTGVRVRRDAESGIDSLTPASGGSSSAAPPAPPTARSPRRSS
jgi:tetratricopeptide (TPR) repeat protein